MLRRIPIIALLLAALLQGTTTLAQGVTATRNDPLGRAIVAEEKGDRAAAIEAYREVLRIALGSDSIDGDRLALAVLGLERLWVESGMPDSVLPVISAVVRVRPQDPVARTVQLRQLTATDRDSEARAAFLEWRRAAPRDAAPYREYARLLLSANRAAEADSVLRDAARSIGARAVAGELAQLRVALGRWEAASVAYREALSVEPWLETAALFALARAPDSARDSIRNVLDAEPATLLPRRLLSALELSWGEPRRAWEALASLPAGDSATLASWRVFAERAEYDSFWSVARDAWLAVFIRTGEVGAQERAASAALTSSEPGLALDIVRRSSAGGDATARVRMLLPVEVRALGELGRAAEAERLVAEKGAMLDPHAQELLALSLVRAWLRSGDVERARKAAVNADLSDDDEVAGWLALYQGDLATARKRLVRTEARSAALNDALALLARTRMSVSPSVGNAFLLLARHDSSAAVRAFSVLGDSAGDASPAFLAIAARIATVQYAGGRDGVGGSGAMKGAGDVASALWKRIAVDFPDSPEAPEALLAWARILRAEGNIPEALRQIEALLTGYPDSALIPQARREYDQLRGQIPPP